jgi:hypothetical protein
VGKYFVRGGRFRWRHCFVVPGWIAWGLISIWFLYRIVKGMGAHEPAAAMDSADGAGA